MSKIHLGTASTADQVYIDLATLISTRLLVTASSGGGKSETLRRILEEACEHVQCIVIDPEGEFSTLREKKPFVLVGEGGETTADVRTAALVATRLLELNVSAVCDLYEMRVQDRHEWVKRFLDAMVHAPKALWHPVIVVIDESHTFCPERGYSESVASQSIIDLANLGRKRGFCPVLATQRLSKLNKNAVEPLQNYLIGRTTFDDQARAASVFKIAPGASTRQFSLELERLAAGQFIARGRAIVGPDMANVQVIRGATRPPATGTAMAGLVTPTPERIKSLLPKLSDLPKEAERKAQTEEDLRRELTDARRRITELERNDASARLAHLENCYEGLAKSYDARTDALQTAADKLEEVALDLRMQVSGERMAGNFKRSAEVAPVTPILSSEPGVGTLHITPNITRPAITNGTVRTGNSMPKACRAILIALAQHGNSSKSKVAALTGYSVNGGGFNNALSECRTKGWITGSDPLSATHEGLEALGSYDALPTGRALLEMWWGRLGKAERSILQALAANHEMTKERLASWTGYEPSGGGFNNALSSLRTLELIDGRGVMRLAPDFAQAVRR